MKSRARALVLAAATSATLSTAAAADVPSFPCLNAPEMTSVFPGDTLLSDQQSFNCFAWQEFIAAVWPSDSSARVTAFGAPGDLAPVMFETQVNVHDLMTANGTTPPDWDQERRLPAAAGASGGKILSRTAKLGNNFDPSVDINEAAPTVAWLADRDGNLVWYEILVNQVEYDYIVQNRYYNSLEQYDALQNNNKKINLPMGQVGGPEGAVEYKAAWLTVPDPENEKWQRYKLSKGTFCTGIGTDDEICTDSVIALIGLHILHKTTSQPSWTWATFEHVDNVPDQAEVNANALQRHYTFFDPDCTPRPVPDGCTAKQPMTTCEPNIAPAYALGPFRGGTVDPESTCQPYPIQATRLFPLPDTNENPIVTINAAAQDLIRQANPDSVFQHYQLINVLWNDSPVDENAGKFPPLAPLSQTAFRPETEAFPVSNPVLETYVQTVTCISCHANATIAGSIMQASPTHASDYSFVFGMAGPDRPSPD